MTAHPSGPCFQQASRRSGTMCLACVRPARLATTALPWLPRIGSRHGGRLVFGDFLLCFESYSAHAARKRERLKRGLTISKAAQHVSATSRRSFSLAISEIARAILMKCFRDMCW